MNLIIKSVSLHKNKRVCIVNLSSDETISLSPDLIVRHGLSKGRAIDDDELTIILREQRIIEIKSAAYNFASYKPRTESQVRQKLKEKGFEIEESDTAINFLYEFDLLDDERFCRQFIQNYLIKKAAGKQKIYFELLKKGIDKSMAANAIEEFFPEDDSYHLALKAAEKKMRMLERKPPEKRKTLMAAYLQRQGFDYTLIRKLVNELFK